MFIYDGKTNKTHLFYHHYSNCSVDCIYQLDHSTRLPSLAGKVIKYCPSFIANVSLTKNTC